MANNRVFLSLCWPNLFSHLAAFNYNGLCPPYPRVDSFFYFSETRACVCSPVGRHVSSLASAARAPPWSLCAVYTSEADATELLLALAF